MAQFCTAYNILATYPHIKYVTMLDDDTLVPDCTCRAAGRGRRRARAQACFPPPPVSSCLWRRVVHAHRMPTAWNEDDVIAIFEHNPATAAVAYPLRASNRHHLWAKFQDLEYLTAGYMKIAQAAGSTTLFASGAINTWRVDVIVDILFRHDTMHHGDDLQQGLILHSLRGKEWFIQTKEHVVHSTSYKVDVYEEAVTATDVPVHWIHAHDWWPRSLLKYAPTRCDCGEPSLFVQRGKGWDLSRQRFLLKYLRVRARPPPREPGAVSWARHVCGVGWGKTHVVVKVVKVVNVAGRGRQGTVAHAPTGAQTGRRRGTCRRAVRAQQTLFQFRAWRTWRSLWVRIIVLHDVYLILNDWVGLGYLIFLLCTLINFLPLVHAVLVIWAFQLLVRCSRRACAPPCARP